MGGSTDLAQVLAALAHMMPMLVAVGWVVRIPFLSREEGHEAITRTAWDGLALIADQRRALIRGVRAPDIGVVGLLASALPFAQRRHALRAWSVTTTADGIQEMRDFMTVRHFRALSIPEGRRRWTTFGEVLHCLQDSYSPAHVDRVGQRIARMKHWGPLDRVRAARSSGLRTDEHGFPTDRRDGAWSNGTLTDEAQAAAATSRRYLEVATRQCGSKQGEAVLRQELDVFLDEWVRGAVENPQVEDPPPTDGEI